MNAKFSPRITSLKDLASKLAKIALKIKIKLGRTLGIEASNTQAQVLVYSALVSKLIERDRLVLIGLPIGEMEEISTLIRPELDEIHEMLNLINPAQVLFNSRDESFYFYELFLKYYDPDLKIKKGLFFTPDPVVDFIVRSVDVLLKKDLGLFYGLRDPALKILDPATGTGSFLSHVMNLVSKEADATNCNSKTNQVPDLIGVELLQVPLMIARLAGTLMLRESRYHSWQARPPRLVLGNALDLPADMKNDVTVVIGNPPYSRSSQNKETLVEPLLASYKNGVKGDKNIQALSDDYVKFFRLAQAIIDESGWGIVGFVSNNTFLRGQIFRGMRKSLLDSFDKIFVLDLHGSSKIQETVPAGVVDQSVFSIQQGTCIVFLVKCREHGVEQQAVMIHDLFGTRNEKFAWLDAHDALNIPWKHCQNVLPPAYPFVVDIVDAKARSEYESFVPLDEILPFNNVGGKPGDDDLFVAFDSRAALSKISSFLHDVMKTPDLGLLTEAKRKIFARLGDFDVEPSKIIPYSYRPFDTRWVYFDARAWTRAVTRIKEQCDGKNLVLLSTKLVKDREFNHVFVTTQYTDVIFLSSTSSTNCYLYPVLYHDVDGIKWNLSPTYLDYLNSMGYPASQDDLAGAIGYIYAILWSSRFKHRYNVLLKQGAPRIPMLQDKAMFEELRTLGVELIGLHLMETVDAMSEHGVALRFRGNDVIKKFRYIDDKVYFNEDQYFEGISPEMLRFAVGKYAVLKKWISDRAGTTLLADDVEKYCKIARAIERSLHIINTIDEVLRTSF